MCALLSNDQSLSYSAGHLIYYTYLVNLKSDTPAMFVFIYLLIFLQLLHNSQPIDRYAIRKRCKRPTYNRVECVYAYSIKILRAPGAGGATW